MSIKDRLFAPLGALLLALCLILPALASTTPAWAHDDHDKGDDKDEVEDLVSDAEKAAKEGESADDDDEEDESGRVFVGRTRNLNRLNPEISFLGDVSYDWSDTPVQDRFLLRGVEISFQASLDPYTRFKGYLAGHQEAARLLDPDDDAAAEEEEAHEDEISVNVEEAYMEWVALPLKTRLRVGKFRQQWGTLNRWHQHSLPTVDMPFALRTTFGDEGLNGLGVSADWTLPGAWADTHAVQVEVVNADNEAAFAADEFDEPAVLLRHTGFFDLGPGAYFEVGLNGMTGPNSEDGRTETTLGGVDLNFVWEPPQRARSRGVEVRAEWIHSSYDTGPTSIDTDSAYAIADVKVARGWSVGARIDRAELTNPAYEILDGTPFREGLKETAVSPFVTWWQSEYVRLRAQYQHVERDFAWEFGPDDDDRFWIQITFAAGPHKHESY